MPGRPNLRQAHLCHSAVPPTSCAGRVASGTFGTVRRRRRLAAGADEWQHGPAPRRLPPYGWVPLGVRPRLPGRPNLRQAHLCHSAVPSASCAGRVARGTCGTARRRRRLAAGAGEWQHGPAPRRLPPYAWVPLGVRLRLPGRPNLRQAHLCHSAVPPASCAVRVARGTSRTARRRRRLAAGNGRVAAKPCSQTPAALCLCLS